ncbi:hypothetical protein [Nitrospira moscoviensis]|uniref:Uncharacterized protein n=1 Tax=Nitrospira moscoviensis TaxID=42253 RepID=A0A0K2GIK1_NITMO|nr:hypothetical protein [Nitrospira moscoviensis]ALA60427.1 hypothetical protein NITMOv2_4043 [Nitrospira moscoviensis]
MKCARCGGLQLWSHFANLGSAVGAWAYDGWRCMNCGDVVDALILENRSLQQETISVAHRVRPFGGNVVWLRARPDALDDDADSDDPPVPRRAQHERRSRQMAG